MKLVKPTRLNLLATLRSMERGDILEVGVSDYSEAYARNAATNIGRERDGRYVVNAIYDENKLRITRVQ